MECVPTGNTSVQYQQCCWEHDCILYSTYSLFVGSTIVLVQYLWYVIGSTIVLVQYLWYVIGSTIVLVQYLWYVIGSTSPSVRYAIYRVGEVDARA
jgi:hypothetical protein